jgi:hypothetical protein
MQTMAVCGAMSVEMKIVVVLGEVLILLVVVLLVE